MAFPRHKTPNTAARQVSVVGVAAAVLGLSMVLAFLSTASYSTNDGKKNDMKKTVTLLASAAFLAAGLSAGARVRRLLAR